MSEDVSNYEAPSVINCYHTELYVEGGYTVIPKHGDVALVKPEDSLIPAYPTRYGVFDLPVTVTEDHEVRLSIDTMPTYPEDMIDDPMFEIPEHFGNTRSLKMWLEMTDSVLIVPQEIARCIGHRRVLCPEVMISYPVAPMGAQDSQVIVTGWTVYD